ncbi:MAG: SIMPL domain-containing protein [Pseudomonadota bacterium]
MPWNKSGALALALCVSCGALRAGAPELLPRPLSCSTSITPDRFVVSGGISAQSVGPKEGSEQIARQLAAMRVFITSKGGTLIVGERLRAARNPERDGGSTKLPFIQVQRIEAEFPNDAEADELIERMLKLGMDRYGKEAGLSENGREFKVLSAFRFAQLDQALAGALASCVRQAAQRECGAQALACAAQARVVAANAQSEALSGSDSYMRSLTLRLPLYGEAQAPLQTDKVELQSAHPLRLRIDGTVLFPGTPQRTGAPRGADGEQ